jgi:hypothetical protein
MVVVQKLIGVSMLDQLWANFRALASSAVMAIGVYFASQHLGHTDHKSLLAAHIGILVALGAILYCGTTFILWMLMKQPIGPEMEVRRITSKILSKVHHA